MSWQLMVNWVLAFGVLVHFKRNLEMTEAIDRVRVLDFEPTNEQMLDALNCVMEVIKSEKYNVAEEKIAFILQAGRSREEIKLTRRLVFELGTRGLYSCFGCSNNCISHSDICSCPVWFLSDVSNSLRSVWSQSLVYTPT
jgi:hypothetical protein